MPVYLRKVASASALWASCSPWFFSAISVASTVPSVFGEQSARRPSAERGLIGLNCFGKPHDQGIGRQFVADRRLGAGAQQCRMVALVEGGGVGAGVDLDAVGPDVVHRHDRGGVRIDEQDDAAAKWLELAERGGDKPVP